MPPVGSSGLPSACFGRSGGPAISKRSERAVGGELARHEASGYYAGRAEASGAPDMGNAGAMLFRGMRDAGDGRPVTGNKADTLGVRVGPGKNADITPDRNGHVHPASGGMSVSNDPRRLPRHRRPPSLMGKADHPVFCIALTSVPGSLAVTPPSRKGHALIEPGTSMLLRAYQELLWGTRESWRIAYA